MNKSNIRAADKIESKKRNLSALVTELHFKNNPGLEKRYGEEGRERCLEDANYHFSYLIEALRVDSDALFSHYLEWAWQMLGARNIPKDDLIENIGYMIKAVEKSLPAADAEPVISILETGAESLKNLQPKNETWIGFDNPLLEEASEYLNLLLNGKRNDAGDLIDKLVNDGKTVADIYEHIFEATQYEVGVLWQRNEITVAHEHYCTAATQLIMARLYPLIFGTEKKGMNLVACSVANELHEIGIRMVSDFFEMDGWDTYYLGSNLPAAHLIQSLREHKADVLALSVTLPVHISKLKTLIEQIRSLTEFDNMKIMAGGYPFTIVSGLDKKVGADATALSAKEAIKTANQMMA